MSGRYRHAEMRSDGILGDKHVELLPGKAEDPLLDPNTPIKVSTNGGGMDELMTEAKKVAVALNELLGTLNKAAKDGDPTSPIGRRTRVCCTSWLRCWSGH